MEEKSGFIHKIRIRAWRFEQIEAQTQGLVAAAGQFFKLEASGGIMLMLAAAAALVVANSDLYPLYYNILHGVDFRIGFSSDETGLDMELKKSLLLWINDGLMAIFFFLIGLEIKKEFYEGNLSTRERAILPAIAAIGGMAVPALIFVFINRSAPETLNGWAIPAATDIAFALGILLLLGDRVPLSLKVLLTAIAVIDDIGAILIIALFYTQSIDIVPLYFAGAALFVLFMLNRRCVASIPPYIAAGSILWLAVLESGIHATIAGVLAAFFLPMRSAKNPDLSPCRSLEHDLHPFVIFGVLPVFAFANAGVPFAGIGIEDFLKPVTFGIIVGLFIGKQLGVFSLIWLTVKLGLSSRPEGTTWRQLYAVAVLCGVGFTMSLFIGGLAYEGEDMQQAVRLGVLAGSLLSALLGYILLRLPARREQETILTV